MSKTIYAYAAAAVLTASLVFPVVTLAQTSGSAADLQAQIDSLLAIIASLKAQIAAQGGGGTPTTWCHTFTTNLSLFQQTDTQLTGSRGVEVWALAYALQQDGDGTFPGLSDMTTNQRNYFEFDEKVAAAVVGFQEKYKSEVVTPAGLAHGTGFVGRLTRAKLNQLYGCGGGNGGTVPPSTLKQNIHVISPNGGEQWAEGSTHTITWSATNPTGVVQIMLLSPINKPGYPPFGVVRILGAVPVSLGRDGYVWTVPPGLIGDNKTSEPYRIQVLQKNGDSDTALAYDVSDNDFIITNGSTTTPPPGGTSRIQVLSPNGGETLRIGSTYAIHWYHYTDTANGDVNNGVTISLKGIDRTTGRESWTQPITGVDQKGQSEDTYSWTIPALLGDAIKGVLLTDPNMVYKIHIEGVTHVFDRGTPDYRYDDSDMPFNITASTNESLPTLDVAPLTGAAPLTVTATLGNAGYFYCAPFTLTWGDGMNDSYPGGGDATCLPGGVPQVKKTHIYTSPGTYTVTFQLQGKAAVSKTITVGSSTGQYSTYFISPKGGESLQTGQTYRVVWGVYPAAPQDGTSIYMSIKSSNGTTQTLAYTLASPGYYNWAVPSLANLPASPDNKYTLILSFQGSTYFNGTLESQPFTINGTGVTPPPPTTVLPLNFTSPAAGVTWVIGTSHGIQWTGGDPNWAMTLSLVSQATNGVARVLASNFSNTGSYVWTVPTDLTAGSYYFYLSRTSGANYIYSSSFTIGTVVPNPPSTGTPSIKVLSPNGGEVWTTGTTQAIQWATSGNLDKATLQVGRYTPYCYTYAQPCPQIVSLPPPVTIASGLPNTGAYQWVVGTGVDVPSGGGLYTISAIGSSATTNVAVDSSDAPFTITPSIAPPPSTTSTIDLSISNAQFTSTGVSATLCTTGLAPATTFPVALTINGITKSVLAYAVTNPCGPVLWNYTLWGATTTVTTALSGLINVDPNNLYAETNETNNQTTVTASAPPKLSVTPISSNAVWSASSLQNVYWVWTGSATRFRIQLTNATTKELFELGINGFDSSLNHASFTVPSTVTTGNYYLHVCDSYYGAGTFVCGDSNTFSVTSAITPPPPASIKPSILSFTSPTGGVTWNVGTPHTIQWIGGDPGYTIEVSLINKTTNSIDRDIAANLTGVNSYVWTVPTDLTPGSYAFYISRTNSSNTGNLYAYGPTITIAPPLPPPPPAPVYTTYFLAPVGTETLQPGQTYKVIWGIQPGYFGTATGYIELIGDTTRITISPAVALTQGSYSVVIPTVSQLPKSATGKYKIQITNPLGSVVSNPFTITGAPTASLDPAAMANVLQGISVVLEQLRSLVSQ